MDVVVHVALNLDAVNHVDVVHPVDIVAHVDFEDMWTV